MKRFLWEPSARADLRRIEQPQALVILQALTRFARGCGGEVKKLTDDVQNRYRLRVGDYRVLFAFENRDTLHILSVENRKDAYR
ncbi:MAG: type toxin-antitoxin system RelE/ParE family toxin [Bryobacterales bacterium]|nr:type toxin-antitoxin system RelE/ParE family toxin [Bryobacterales bacterium]